MLCKLADSLLPWRLRVRVLANRNFSGTVCTLLQIRQLYSRRGVNNYNATGI